MELNNYYFYMDIQGSEDSGSVVFKILSAGEQKDGTITLCLLNKDNEKIDSSIPRRLANRFPLFRENAVSSLVGKYILINYEFVTYETDEEDNYFGVEDARNLAIEVNKIEEATGNDLKQYQAREKLCVLVLPLNG